MGENGDNINQGYKPHIENTFGYETSNEENRKQIMEILLGGEKELGSQLLNFDPHNREDVMRIYRRNEKGEYEPAFPEAATNPEFTGLNEIETIQVTTPNNGYLYYEAGTKNQPLVFQKTKDGYFTTGLWTKTKQNPQHGKKDADKAVPKFAGGVFPRQQMTDEQLAAEKKRKKLEVFLKGADRASETIRSMYGSKLDHVGTQTFQTYDEQWVDNIRKAGGESYPVPPEGVNLPPLSEDDVASLSMLNMCRPDVNGGDIPGMEDAEINFVADMNFDTYYNRQSSNKNQDYLKAIVNGRKKTKEILTDYYGKNANDPALYDGMAEALANGLPMLAALNAHPTGIQTESISRCNTLKKVSDLLDRHPGLLDAARKKAVELNKLDDFERSLRQCRTMAKTYEFSIESAKQSLRLAKHEAGILYNDNGNKIILPQEEVDALKLEAEEQALLDDMLIHHEQKLSDHFDGEMKDIETEATTLFKDGTCKYVTEKITDNVQISKAQQRMFSLPTVHKIKSETMPVLNLIFEHEGGKEVFDHIVKNAERPLNHENITQILINNKLIPTVITGEPKFDYANGIKNYVKAHPDVEQAINDKHAKEDVKEDNKEELNIDNANNNIIHSESEQPEINIPKQPEEQKPDDSLDESDYSFDINTNFNPANNINNVNNIVNINNVNSINDDSEAVYDLDKLRIGKTFNGGKPNVVVENPNAERISVNFGILTSTEENRKKLLTNMFGVPGEDTDKTKSLALDMPFDPSSREDVARLFKKNEKGVYCQAFPEAENLDFNGLTEKQTMEVLDPNNQYIYFLATDDAQPRMIAAEGSFAGTWMSYDKVLPNAEQPRFDKKGQARLDFVARVKNNDKKAEEQSKRETRRKALNYEYKRYNYALDTLRRLYGSKLDSVGTDYYQSFSEQWVGNVKKFSGVDYPDPNTIEGRQEDISLQPPVLDETDVSTLTMLNMADPNVNGMVHRGPSKESVTAVTIDLSLDTFIDRASTNTGVRFLTGIKNARNKTNEQLTEYYKSSVGSRVPNSLDKDKTDFVWNKNLYDDMGKSLCNGLPILAQSNSFPTYMNYNSAAKLAIMRHVDIFTQRHPDVLEAARKYAKEQGKTAEFEENFKKCRFQSKLSDQIVRSLQAEQRLAEYEAGNLADEYGKPYKMPAEEQKYLQDEVKKCQALEGINTAYTNKLNNKLLPQIAQNMMNASKEKDDLDKEEGKIKYPGLKDNEKDGVIEAINHEANAKIRNANPMSPIFDLIYDHEGGMQAFEHLLKSVELSGNARQDGDKLTQALIEEGLLPGPNESAQNFSYDQAIMAYEEKYNLPKKAKLPENTENKKEVNEIKESKELNENDLIKNDEPEGMSEKNPEFKELNENNLIKNDEPEGMSEKNPEFKELNENDLIKNDEPDGMSEKNPVDEEKKSAENEKETVNDITPKQEPKTEAEILEFLGLDDEETIAELAANHRISPDEYKKRAVAEYNRAKMESARRANEAKKVAEGDNEAKKKVARINEAATALGAAERKLNAQMKNMNGQQLCSVFKELNGISERNKSDTYLAYQTGELLSSVCKQMVKYEKEHAEFAREKKKYLSKKDFEQAKVTVRRSANALKTMKMKPVADAMKHVELAGEGITKKKTTNEEPMLIH